MVFPLARFSHRRNSGVYLPRSPRFVFSHNADSLKGDRIPFEMVPPLFLLVVRHLVCVSDGPRHRQPGAGKNTSPHLLPRGRNPRGTDNTPRGQSQQAGLIKMDRLNSWFLLCRQFYGQVFPLEVFDMVFLEGSEPVVDLGPFL